MYLPAMPSFDDTWLSSRAFFFDRKLVRLKSRLAGAVRGFATWSFGNLLGAGMTALSQMSSSRVCRGVFVLILKVSWEGFGVVLGVGTEEGFALLITACEACFGGMIEEVDGIRLEVLLRVCDEAFSVIFGCGAGGNGRAVVVMGFDGD